MANRIITQDDIRRTDAYMEVLEHQLKCKAIKNGLYCDECVGGGIVAFTEKVCREILQGEK